MPQTKFFHQLQEPIEVHIHMKAPKRSGDQKDIPIIFRIELNGNTVRSSPPFVRNAYENVKSGNMDDCSLPHELTMIDCSLYDFPDKKRATIQLPRIHLKNMAVKIAKNSEGDKSTVLSFETLYPWDKAIWEYMGDHYKTHVYARFDSAQATLLDIEEMDKKGEDVDDDEEQPVNGGALSMDNYRDSEQAKSVAEMPTKRKGKDAAVGSE